MLWELMRECNNFFVASEAHKSFTIQNSVIDLENGYLPGQYIVVSGSVLNDGLYLLTDTEYTLEGARDETFWGSVYGLRVPKDFVRLSEEIDTWIKANPATAITSESFGAYSRSMAQGKAGGSVTWQEQFVARLRPFRRLYPQIEV